MSAYVEGFTNWFMDGARDLVSDPRVIPGGTQVIFDEAQYQLELAVERGMGPGEEQTHANNLIGMRARHDIDGAKGLIIVLREWTPAGYFTDKDGVTQLDPVGDLENAGKKVAAVAAGGVFLYVAGGLLLMYLATRR